MSDNFDWSAKRFLPIRIERSDSRIILKAGGSSIYFKGNLFHTHSDAPLNTSVEICHPASKAQGEFAVFLLKLKADRDTILHDVTWFAGEWEPAAKRVIASTNLQDIVLFLRRGNVSFFLSLDFPFSRITPGGISYPAGETIKAGKTYLCHTLSVGACRLSGQQVNGFDRSEIEAVSAYVEQRFTPRFQRPMFISSCITNRMTYCRDNRIFYSMYDNPTIALNPDLLEEDIRLMAKIGVEYLQLFEGEFDWPDQRKTAANMRRLYKLARKLGIRLGDYVVPQGLYCPHYNYAGRQLNNPQWLQKNSEGKLGSYCLGCREYVDSFLPKIIAHNKRFGLEMICLDFLAISPCYATNHGHQPGDIYQQVKALVSICASLNAISPNYMIWSNSGNWEELLPKLYWWNQNIYLTDPHVREYAPALNVLKLLGDGRREQMVSIHEKTFTPYRAFTNCEYYAFRRSREPDMRVFEYSFLQGLAVTPNICPAETRVFLNTLPAANRELCISFMKKWTDFIKAHFDVWKRTARVGDSPGVGATEIYSHIKGKSGYVCLINQNPFPRSASFKLDSSIGLSGGSRFLIKEIYPKECLIAEQDLPYSKRGSQIKMELPAHSVKYLKIIPVKGVTVARPVVYGLPGRVQKIKGGYRLHLKAPQGETMRLGVVLPQGKKLKSIVARQTPTVPLYTFPVTAKILKQRGNNAWIDVTFPRGKSPHELTKWVVKPSNASVELPQIDHCCFLGARVTGAFSEDYSVEVDLLISSGIGKGTLAPLHRAGNKASSIVRFAMRQIFETEFDLPFIESLRFGFKHGYDYDTLIELVFRDPDMVDSLKVKLNGHPVEVRKYFYPGKTNWFTWYIELTGVVEPGHIKMSVDVTWKKHTKQ